MREDTTTVEPNAIPSAGPSQWRAPLYEVISLDCEITSYLPDDGSEPPLF